MEMKFSQFLMINMNIQLQYVIA